MNLVVDANILFAALIKESTTENLLFNDLLTLYSPEVIFIEFEKHAPEILAKTYRNPGDIPRLIAILKRRIKVIPSSEFLLFIHQASGISPDPNDTEYFALALKLNCGIWSNDKALKRQDKIEVYNTQEIMEKLQA